MEDETTDPVVLAALEWFVRMRDGNVSATDRANFEIWLHEDPSHVVALQHAEALWKRFDIAQPEFDRLRETRGGMSRRHILFGALAATIGSSGLYLYNRPDLFADCSTGIAERQTFILKDGSSVELGSYSALSVNFTQRERLVELHRGEGFFDVASDRDRPFVVRAGGGMTRALGTRFDVKHVGDLVTVCVSEHAVGVEVGSTPGIRVEQGWQLSYDNNGAGGLTKSDPDAVEAWRRDRIVFADVPLRRVLRELERYRAGRIILMDRSLGDIPVTAVFDTQQAEDALNTIAATLPVRVLHATNYVAFVYSS